VLRAYAKYMRQTGVSFSQSYIEETLTRYPDIAQLLFTLFEQRLDPAGKQDAKVHDLAASSSSSPPSWIRSPTWTTIASSAAMWR
jgi:glutamate dehydrogenase